MFAGRLDLFSDTAASLLTVAYIFVSDSWSDLLWQGVAAACSTDTRSRQLPAAPDTEKPFCAGAISSTLGALYFISFYFIFQFVLLALLVAVIIDKLKGVTQHQTTDTQTHLAAIFARCRRGLLLLRRVRA